MTFTADELAHRDRREIVRWTASLLIVLALHGGLVLLVMLYRARFEPIGMPPAAVMIDLAPAPVASPAASPPPAAEPTPPEPEAPALPLPEPQMPAIEPRPAPHPPVVLPAPQPPKPSPKPRARPPVARPPTPRREPESAMPAPAAPAPPAAAQPAPPAPASSTPGSSAASARATWQAQLLAWLERYKRYPRLAQEQRQQGVAHLRFTLDRQGKVLSFRVDKSSGFTLLDDEVSELIQRAQPLPPPPAEIAGERIEVLVPVVFSLRRGGG